MHAAGSSFLDGMVYVLDARRCNATGRTAVAVKKMTRTAKNSVRGIVGKALARTTCLVNGEKSSTNGKLDKLDKTMPRWLI